MADRIAVLNEGVIQQLGTPGEIYDQPVNHFVAGFMGSPSMNMLPVQIIRGKDGVAARFESGDGTPVVLPVAPTMPGLNERVGKPCILGLRPEAITGAESMEQAAPRLPEIMNRVDVVEPAGSDTFLISRMAGIDVIARVAASTRVRPGAEFRFAVNMARALFFDPDTGQRI